MGTYVKGDNVELFEGKNTLLVVSLLVCKNASASVLEYNMIKVAILLITLGLHSLSKPHLCELGCNFLLQSNECHYTRRFIFYQYVFNHKHNFSSHLPSVSFFNLQPQRCLMRKTYFLSCSLNIPQHTTQQRRRSVELIPIDCALPGLIKQI